MFKDDNQSNLQSFAQRLMPLPTSAHSAYVHIAKPVGTGSAQGGVEQ